MWRIKLSFLFVCVYGKSLQKILIYTSYEVVVIDLHTAMDGMPELFPDKIHPNEAGAKVMAKAVYQSLKK